MKSKLLMNYIRRIIGLVVDIHMLEYIAIIKIILDPSLNNCPFNSAINFKKT